MQRFPSLATLEALARGLQVEMSFLVDIARSQSSYGEGSSGAIEASVEFVEQAGPYPMTSEERMIMDEVRQAGISEDLILSLGLFDCAPQERRVALHLLQALASDLMRRVRPNSCVSVP